MGSGTCLRLPTMPGVPDPLIDPNDRLPRLGRSRGRRRSCNPVPPGQHGGRSANRVHLRDRRLGWGAAFGPRTAGPAPLRVGGGVWALLGLAPPAGGGWGVAPRGLHPLARSKRARAAAAAAGVGKTSLITAAATETFPDHPPPVLPPARLPAETTPEAVPLVRWQEGSTAGHRVTQRDVQRLAGLLRYHIVQLINAAQHSAIRCSPRGRAFTGPSAVWRCEGYRSAPTLCCAVPRCAAQVITDTSSRPEDRPLLEQACQQVAARQGRAPAWGMCGQGQDPLFQLAAQAPPAGRGLAAASVSVSVLCICAV